MLLTLSYTEFLLNREETARAYAEYITRQLTDDEREREITMKVINLVLDRFQDECYIMDQEFIEDVYKMMNQTIQERIWLTVNTTTGKLLTWEREPLYKKFAIEVTYNFDTKKLLIDGETELDSILNK